jgi:AraC-like DNA-binding protein
VEIALCSSTRTLVHLLHIYSKQLTRVAPQRVTHEAPRSRRPDDFRTPARRAAKQLRESDIDRLVERYQAVRNLRKIADEFHLSRTTVAKHLASRGVATSRRMSPAAIQLANELYRGGLSSAAIGHQLGFDNKTVLSSLAPESIRRR